ncbi:hypothetical protein F4782DRAFT_116428 [Xylaria castorea]|nr:hypothetical protein F4782DRAFT_116428 [Xylaria castorea]
MTTGHFGDLATVPDERTGINEYGRLGPNTPKSVPNYDDSAIPEAVPWEYRGNGIHTAGNETEVREMSRPPPGAGRFARKCGLPIRVFYGVLALVVLLIIGGIAGGVAGSLTSASKARDEENPTIMPTNTRAATPTATQTTTLNTHVLATSKLSATNWTNPYDGTVHRFVSFQDPFNAIIVRRWDSDNRTWTTNNLTDLFFSTRYPINVLTPSTSLAIVSCFSPKVNELHIYYVAPDNTITEGWIPDLVNEPDAWEHNNLWDATFETFPGSQIAVAWQRGYSVGSLGWWALAWQRKDDGAILLANASDYNNPQVAIPSEEIVQGTSLALISELNSHAPTLSRLTMMSEVLSSPMMGIVKKFSYETSWFFDGRWLNDRDIPPPTAGLQFALTRLDDVTTLYFLALLPNGTITGEYYANGFKQVPKVAFPDGPSDVNFTAIAATEENMVYGISGDSVLQYSVDGRDPSVFHFEEVVFP